MTTKFNVARLKELLRERNLPTSGSKADLLLQLREHAPDIVGAIEEEDSVSEEAAVLERRSHGGNASAIEELEPSQSHALEANQAASVEVELLRRERDLLRRKLELIRREAERRNQQNVSMSDTRSPVSSDYGNNNVRAIKDLLNEFNRTGNEFWKWKRQVELLRDSYNLDDNSTRVLISSKLKGKALDWFHSRPEHITLSIPSLWEKMKQMFDHRPSKLALRREFEQRMWQAGESFVEYYHSKTILANRPIDDNELVDYIIDDIPDFRL